MLRPLLVAMLASLLWTTCQATGENPSGLTALLSSLPMATEKGGLPLPDVGFGLIVDYATHGDQWPQVAAQMLALGCNTMTVYGHGGTDGRDIAWQIDTGLDLGLLDTRFPVLFAPSVKWDEDMLALSLSMRSVGDKDHGSHRLPVCTQQPEHRWPELIGCNLYMPTVEQRDKVEALTGMYRKGASSKSGAFIAPEQVEPLRDLLNVFILPCDQWQASTVEAMKKWAGRTWAWAPLVDDDEAQRKATGLWVFINRPQVILFSGWSPGCPGEAGFREGVADYRVLRALERKARDELNTAQGAEAWAWLKGLTVDGAGTCAELREKAEGYLGRLG